MKFLPCALLALAALPLSANAFTECPNQILTRVWTDVNGDVFIATMPSDQALNGRIPVAAYPTGSKTAVAIALMAYAQKLKVKIRYRADGINCAAAQWDAEIMAIGVND